MTHKFHYIDVFSGCGGLSLGLEKAGFKLGLAIEKSDMAAETFFHNFIERITDIEEWKKFSSKETSVEEQADKKLIVKELSAVLNSEKVINKLKNLDVDLIAGGPPCQGFSMAGRRNPKDVRNQLPWQFLELIEKVNPKTVLIENVSGMRHNFVKHSKDAPFEQLRIALSETGIGYLVQPIFLNAMHFGVPQHRPRVMLIGIRKDIGQLLNISVTEETWKSDYDQQEHMFFKERPDLAPKGTYFGENILTVEDAIWDLSEEGYLNSSSDSLYRKKRGKYAKKLRDDISWMSPAIKKTNRKPEISNHNLRNHAAHIKTRFRLYQYLRDNNISSRTLNVPAKSDLPNQGKLLEVKGLLCEAKFPAKSPDGTLLAKNIEELAQLVVDLNTKKHSQRPLALNAPSPTVVSLPDDFVHPLVPRTLTVREMARFQSFPDSFIFRAKETTGSLRRRFEVPQYTQVGNAVPPILANAVGKIIHDTLLRYAKVSSENYDKKVV
ncbi:MAG: DNA (cytosine-5-)-methyltransferase [Alphaproteobacteria bacterium]|nr:MAG: DNA (cytosine-5-)-methyltransferase [Alphaproteobacteria bacterium]